MFCHIDNNDISIKRGRKGSKYSSRGPDECFYLVDFGVEASRYQDFGNDDYSCLSNPEKLESYGAITYAVDGTKDKVNKVSLVFTTPNKVSYKSEERMFLLSGVLSKRMLQREMTKDELKLIEKLLFEKDGIITFDNFKFEVKTEKYEKASGYKKEFIIEL